MTYSQTPETVDALKLKANQAASAKDAEKAALFYEQAANAEEISPNPRTNELINLFSNAGLYFAQAKNYRKAIEFYVKAKDETSKTYGNNHTDYLTCLNNLAILKVRLKDYKDALPIFQELLKRVATVYGKDHENYFIYAINLGKLYVKIGQDNEAISYLETGYSKLRNDHKEYSNTQKKLAELYEKKGNYTKALSFYNDILSDIESKNGKQYPYYALNLANAANMNNKLGNYDMALKQYQETLQIAKNLYGSEHEFYGICLYNLALLYYDLDELDLALTKAQQSLVITEKTLGKTDNQYANNLELLASIDEKKGNYENAIKLFKEALEITKNNLGKENKEYIDTLNGLGIAQLEAGKLKNAHSTLVEARNLALKFHGKAHPSYALVINNLSGLYMKLGQFDKAIPLLIEVTKIYKETLGVMHPNYANLLNNFCHVYLKTGKYNEAIELYKFQLRIIEKTLGKDHESYARIQSNLASAYTSIKEYDKSIKNYREALKITEQQLGKEHPNYALKLASLAVIYMYNKDYDKSKKLMLEAKAITEKYMGKNHENYNTILDNLAALYEQIGEPNKVIDLYKESNAIRWSKLNTVFSFSNEIERKNFMTELFYDFEAYQNFDYRNDYQSPDFVEMNLNNHYLLNGLLLNSYTNMLDELAQLEDATINRLIYDYQNTKKLQALEVTKEITNRRFNVDSLKKVIGNKESLLVKKHSKYFNRQQPLADWKKVKENLKSEDLVIEFSKFRHRQNYKWTSESSYMAYVFDKTSKSPTAVYLFEEQELKKIIAASSPSVLYASRGSSAKTIKTNTSTELYNLIWKPLEAHFSNKENIYFAPSGLLNQIALTALPDENNNYMLSNYQMYQMSNTAKISDDIIKIDQSNALLIGGVDYDSIFTSTSGESNTLFELENLKTVSGTRSMSSKWNYLPGTLEEIKAIAQLFKSENVTTQQQVATKATETAFKQISGNSTNIIHIATHGYFFENAKVNYETNTDSSTKNVYKTSEDPLLRSGLIFAGANEAWTKGANPNAEDDGILTALEISSLNLSNTDLVVLSACETGLGDIDGNEGVYGLQRAFKMAGVDIIMMSLWEVPDAETAEFMQLFYGSWLSGKTVHQAFRDTQLQMASNYKDNPEKWAAFVLVE